MNANHILEPTLEEILQLIKPVQSDWDTRNKVIDQLRSVLESVQSLKGATIQPFGSFVSNLFTRWGDLDISVDLFSSESILWIQKEQKQALLRHLLEELRITGGFYKLRSVVHARVPIVKAVSSIESIPCDVSIDNLKGLLKSRFLLWISEIDGRFRDMVLLVKQWAKANDINNRKARTFNSYSLTLLVIFHFQTCVPAILPPLRDIYPRNAVDDLIGVRRTAEESIAQISAANIAKFKANRSRSVNRSSLSELFVSFFAKFSDINLKAEELGVCLFTGRWENISNNTRWLPKTYSLFVEDPFDQLQNAARSISRENLDKIAKIFEMTWRSLTSDCSRNSILGVLTEPHISQSLLRTSIASPSYNLQGQAPLHDQFWPPHSWSHQMQENLFLNNTWNLQGYAPVQAAYWQTPIHDQSGPQHSWSHQMQQSWFPNNTWNLQGYEPAQSPYWQTPIPSPRQQNWSQSNRMNLLGKTPVQGQTWPVTTQTPTQQGQYMNGKGPTRNRSYNNGIPPKSAGSSQNQGHIPGHINGLNSGIPAPINQGRREQTWKSRTER